jgi:hypothetical protein
MRRTGGVGWRSGCSMIDSMAAWLGPQVTDRLRIAPKPKVGPLIQKTP